MSDLIEQQRIGGRIVCTECGVPLPKDKFVEGSVICRGCLPHFHARRRTIVGRDEITKTAHDLALEELKRTQKPMLATGVKKAQDILGGQTSTEILAQAIRITLGLDLDEEKRKLYPVDNSLLTKQLALMQKAEQSHDDALKGKPSAIDNMTTEQLTSIMLDRAINEMLYNKEIRTQILTALMERVPTFYQEVIAIARVTLAEASPDEHR